MDTSRNPNVRVQDGRAAGGQARRGGISEVTLPGHPMHAVAPKGGVEHATGGGAQAVVIVRNDKFHAAQAAIGKRA